MLLCRGLGCEPGLRNPVYLDVPCFEVCVCVSVANSDWLYTAISAHLLS